jgi:hypothetical protein
MMQMDTTSLHNCYSSTTSRQIRAYMFMISYNRDMVDYSATVMSSYDATILQMLI